MGRRVFGIIGILALLLAAACGGGQARSLTPASSPRSPIDADSAANTTDSDDLLQDSPSTAKTPVIVDQISLVIREATDEYLLGEEAYRSGDLDVARRHFDQAVLTYMTCGLSVIDEPRLREAYGRVVQDIQSLEADAASGGDEVGAEGAESPVEELKDITSFLTPEELALEMSKIRPPTEADHFSIPVVLNERVLTFIDAFQKQFRRPFEGGYQRMGRYEEMIRRTFREEGLPEDLIYVAFIESTFKPNAFSRARAKGIWQFMASTGARYGLVRNAYVDERSDPEKATRAAARYLKDLYAIFGDWYLVMASYNAGEGLIIRAMDRTGKRDFWELAQTRYLKAETKNFVPSILALSIMSREPARYGFEGLTKDPPLEFDRMTLDGPTDLGLVARLSGTTVEAIRGLNPQLTRTVTPPGYRSYQLRVPKGKGESVQAAYDALPASMRIAPVRATYRVRKGETLASVARRFGTSASVLAEANGLSQGARITSGMTLVVPGGVEPARDGGRARASSRGGPSRAGADGRYTVRPGDTLFDIARRHGTTVEKITDLNGITQRTVLKPGQVLRVTSRAPASQPPVARSAATPGGQQAPPSAQSSMADATQKLAYKVRSGDNLYRIAMKYGTTVEDLKSWNNLGPRSRIYPGDVLTIYRD